MNSAHLGDIVAAASGVSLADLDDQASLLTRKDRKYLVSPALLAGVLSGLSEAMSVLEMGGRRWFEYETLYFDTDALDAYHLAARRRRSRFKIRTRRYVDAGTVMVEVKTKDRRGRTVKRRTPLDTDRPHVLAAQDFAGTFDEVAEYSKALVPVLTSHFQRATLLFPASGVRATLDRDFGAELATGGRTCLDGMVIVETKTTGRASALDRRLWRAGARPVKFSKYSTGMAVLRPDLPSNRWARVVRHLTTMHAEPAGSSAR